VGESPQISEVRELMQQVSKRKANVLLLGESGTGKEIVARNIHYHSGRGDRSFIAVNCAGEGEHFENHLFGHVCEAGDSDESGQGYLEKADGGTLFLDKVTEMPLAIQACLLSFLEKNSFRRKGEQKERQVDVRLVVASNVDIKQRVSQGKFREDLFYLLNMFPITLPPLREHAEDIPALIKELITRLEHEGQTAIRLSSSALESLERCEWPGNVRELTNLIERLSIINEGKVIGINDLPPEYRHATTEFSANQPTWHKPKPLKKKTATLKPQAQLKIIAPLTVENLKQHLDNFEKEMLEMAIQDCSSIKQLAAERLRLDMLSFDKKLIKHGLKLEA